MAKTQRPYPSCKAVFEELLEINRRPRVAEPKLRSRSLVVGNFLDRIPAGRS
jgi:hypothetical protein